MLWSLVSLFSLDQGNQNEVQHDCLVKWCYWHRHHVTLIVSSIPPLHSFGHSDQNEMQHDFLVMCYNWFWCWHHMMLVSAACDANGIVSTSFNFSGQDNWNKHGHGTWVGIMWCWWCHKWQHFIPLVKKIEIEYMTFLINWHCNWHHMMAMTSSMVQLHSFGQDC